jgi:molybdate transport system substrate-binding protein
MAGSARTRSNGLRGLPAGPVRTFASAFAAACATLALPAGTAGAAPVLTVAAASNVQFAMEEINAAFIAAHGAEVKAVFNSSGKLAAQIRNGAPFDVFVSADMAFPDSLRAWGQAAGDARPYALGLLVLWTMRTDIDPARGLPLLAEAAIRKVAIPDPALAPYGREARNALAKAGLEAAVAPKLVYAQNIGQAGQFVVTGAADIGFNAKSVVLAPDLKTKGKWAELDRAAYSPIAQGAVVLRYGQDNNPGASAKFFAFLFSEAARIIFAKYGYLSPDAPSDVPPGMSPKSGP